MKNNKQKHHTKSILISSLFLCTMILIVFLLSHILQAVIPSLIENVNASSQVVWPAFDGGGSRTGVFTGETVFTTSNANSLTQLWQQTLPYKTNGSPVYASSVVTSSGTKDLVFFTTQQGSLIALDAATGNQVWRADTSGQFIANQGTSSSPAIDPSNQFIYSYGLDGKVHKYAIGTGVEDTTGGFPVTVTLQTSVEKESSPLNIGNGYLYTTTSGYDGDFGTYVGHVVAVHLADGTTTVFNSLCSNLHMLFTSTTCSQLQSGIWGRGGAVIDPETNNVFVTTGNGTYDANTGGVDYGDSVIELSPDLSHIIDTYTPSNYATLDSQDLDLGSAAPVMIPRQSNTATPLLALQGGKDNKLRLLNRQNLSGAGGPNHVGGELQTISVSCMIFSHSVVWQDNGGTTWVFVSDMCNNLYAFKVVNANNQSTLQLVYQKTGINTSPFIAGGVLFGQEASAVNAYDPTTGNLLWTGAVGPDHWQSPIAINGRLFVPDDNGIVTAFVIPGTQMTPTPTPTPTSTPIRSIIAQDTFQRANQALWGKASDGQTWGADANKLTSFSIVNNAGQIAETSSTNMNAILGPSVNNAEVLVSGSMNKIGGSNNIGVAIRWTSASNFYKAIINGTNFIIQKNLKGSVTALATVAFKAMANTSYTIRFNVTGTTLSAKVWKTGTTEPANWMLSATDTSIASGYCGLRMLEQKGTVATITSFTATSM
jgi:outer membrane protein assembly factor BamB